MRGAIVFFLGQFHVDQRRKEKETTVVYVLLNLTYYQKPSTYFHEFKMRLGTGLRLEALQYVCNHFKRVIRQAPHGSPIY